MTRYRRSAVNATPPVRRFVCTPFMRDIGVALSLKFVLLGVLYYACFDGGGVSRTHPDAAAVARAVLGGSTPLSEIRHDR